LILDLLVGVMRPLIMIYSRNPLFLKAASEVAAQTGFYIETALDAEEAKYRINMYPPHIIYIDYETGKDFYKELEAVKRLELIPVIFIADKINLQAAVKLLNARIGDAVTKPLKAQDVTIRSEVVLGQSTKKFPLFVDTKSIKNCRATIKLSGKLTEISEVGCLINSEARVDSSSLTRLKSKFFVELGFELPYSLLYQKYSGNTGTVNTCGASFIGLGEDDLVKIRGWINKRLTRLK
jgi:DNA-binding response OmpR family regulator